MVGLIVFRADSCPHCRAMDKAGVLKELKRLRPDLKVVVEDLSKGLTELAETLNVRVIPLFVLLDGRGEVLKRSTGSKTATDLSRWAVEPTT